MKNVWITLLCLLPLAAFAQKDQGRIVYLETINMKFEFDPEMQQYAHLIPTEQKSKMDLYFNAHESLYTQNTDPVETEENPFEEGNAVTIRIGMGEGSQI
ncbi:MAG: hypothetical protein KDC44_01605, partial [Phaeodactylibacter sp.]|nr:hypothetical protein [Phaeodactylibacter sp.]